MQQLSAWQSDCAVLCPTRQEVRSLPAIKLSDLELLELTEMKGISCAHLHVI